MASSKKDIAGSGLVGNEQDVQTVVDPHVQTIAAVITGVLGLTISVWSYFSDRRNKELFDDEAITNQIVEKCKQSEDFASFVFDVWQKHNLESSEERRLMLKKFLQGEACKNSNDFENFSKIEFIIQNANL